MSTQRPRQPHHSPKIVNESIRSLVQRIPREMVMKLALALVADSSSVTLDDVNELLLSAGYAPLLSRGESVPWN